MGVHDHHVYHAIKSVLEIEEEEPIFIIRGQDQLALATLEYYNSIASDAGCSAMFLDDVRRVKDEFNHFQVEHSDQMKRPD